jgi:hypothetical protein
VLNSYMLIRTKAEVDGDEAIWKKDVDVCFCLFPTSAFLFSSLS